MISIEVNMFKLDGELEGLCSPVLTVREENSEEKIIIPLSERIPIEDAEEVISIIKENFKDQSFEDIQKLVYG